tara:strand:- start:847 stop:1278 length:432 start_codon:yes stop_codon:yes gene_type:complete
MALYGIGGGTIGTTSFVRSSWVTVNLHSTSDWYTAGTDTLAPGTYYITMSACPSTNSGDYNNSDPDQYQLRMEFDNTTVIGDTPTGYESAPHLHMQTIAGLSYVVGWTSGNKTIRFQARTTDADAGGFRGALFFSCSRILSYA